jgi:hypothetical protein
MLPYGCMSAKALQSAAMYAAESRKGTYVHNVVMLGDPRMFAAYGLTSGSSSCNPKLFE